MISEWIFDRICRKKSSRKAKKLSFIIKSLIMRTIVSKYGVKLLKVSKCQKFSAVPSVKKCYKSFTKKISSQSLVVETFFSIVFLMALAQLIANRQKKLERHMSICRGCESEGCDHLNSSKHSSFPRLQKSELQANFYRQQLPNFLQLYFTLKSASFLYVCSIFVYKIVFVYLV